MRFMKMRFVIKWHFFDTMIFSDKGCNTNKISAKIYEYLSMLLSTEQSFRILDRVKIFEGRQHHGRRRSITEKIILVLSYNTEKYSCLLYSCNMEQIFPLVGYNISEKIVMVVAKLKTLRCMVVLPTCGLSTRRIDQHG